MANKKKKSVATKKQDDVKISKNSRLVVGDSDAALSNNEVSHALVAERSSSFSGPLPHPAILKEYNLVLKDGAERIMQMVEKQSSHRMSLEQHTIKEELRQSSRGQVFGFILGIVGLGLATWLTIQGHETIAGIFGATTIIGLVTVFVIGKKIQQKELSEKD